MNKVSLFENNGNWTLEDGWSDGYFIQGAVIVANVPVPGGVDSYVDLAEALCQGLCKYSGAWLEDGAFSFVHQKRTIVVLTVHAAERSIDATWYRPLHNDWHGMDGRDFRDEVTAAESTVRAGMEGR